MNIMILVILANLQTRRLRYSFFLPFLLFSYKKLTVKARPLKVSGSIVHPKISGTLVWLQCVASANLRK